MSLSRSYSFSPLTEENMLPLTNKFVGESFSSDQPNVRTIYAGAKDDPPPPKTDRVILLIGPQTTAKATLIDYFCNFFYGARLDDDTRYHIANETFDNETPQKSIITYMFNESNMNFRPVVIDTTGAVGKSETDELSDLFTTFIRDKKTMRIDAIGVVFSATTRMTTAQEEQLKKTLDFFPPHVCSNMVVFVTESDGAPPSLALLKRFNLHNAKVFKLNTSCLYQKKQEDALKEHLRGNYWRMSSGNLTGLFYHLSDIPPVTISGEPHDSAHFRQRESSYDISPFESQSSATTTIHQTPVETYETDPHSGETTRRTTTKSVTTNHQVTSNEQTFVHGTAAVLLDSQKMSSQSSGMPLTLLEEIRSRRNEGNTTRDSDVVVIEYKTAPPEAVLIPHSHRESRIEETTLNLSPDREKEEFGFTSMTLQNLTRGFGSPVDSTTKSQVPVAPPLPPSPNDKPSFTGMTALPPSQPQRYQEAQPVTKSITTTSSTLVNVNDDGVKQREHIHSYSPRTTNEVKMRQGTVRISDANRLSGVDLGRSMAIDHILTPPHEVLGGNTLPRRARDDADSSVIRYTYDCETRTHKSHVVGHGGSERRDRDSFADFDRIRRSRSFEPLYTRLTLQGDRFGEPAGGYTSVIRESSSYSNRNSSLEPHLIHSEDRYAVVDKDGKAVTPHPAPAPIGRAPTFDRFGDSRRSLHRPRSKSPPVPARRASDRTPGYGTTPGGTNFPITPSYNPYDEVPQFGRQRPAYDQVPPIGKGATPTGTLPKNLDMRDNPEYSINPHSPIRPIGQGVLPPVHNQPSPTRPIGGGVLPTNGGIGSGVEVPVQREPVIMRPVPGRGAVPSYAGEPHFKEREDMLRKTRDDVNRDSYPHRRPHQTQYENLPLSPPPRNSIHIEFPPPPGRNDIMIPPQIRDSTSPMQPGYIPLPHPHQHKDSDFGDDWDESIPRRHEQHANGGIGGGVRPTQPQQQPLQPVLKPVQPPIQPMQPGTHGIGKGVQPQAPPNQRQQQHQNGFGRENRPPNLQPIEHQKQAPPLTHHNDPRSPPPPYLQRPYPGTPHGKPAFDDVEGQHYNAYDPMLDGGRGKAKKNSRGRSAPSRSQSATSKKGKKGKSTTTTTVVTRRTHFKTLNWTPMNCGNSRDCFLNCMFCVVAPIVVLCIVAVIIIIVIVT